MKKNLLTKTFVGLTVAGAGAIAAYAFAVRPWHLRWGATDEELTEILSGDDVKPEAGVQVTHAITINAAAADIWAWLVQIGQDRGGFYSYDWIENLFGLQVQNAEQIVSEWQELKVGDFVRSADKGWLGGRFDETAGWFVVALEPNRTLVLRDEVEQGSWAFVLRTIDENTTRLIVRARGNAPESPGRKVLHFGIFEPAHFVMERKMLLTLKERAETNFRRQINEIEANQPMTAENLVT